MLASFDISYNLDLICQKRLNISKKINALTVSMITNGKGMIERANNMNMYKKRK